ncbi:DUF4288 domain-containing protein [Microtetraspora malaysiensis]|uniref:DUF4288 domain-containing protein n=1 Tax=Microtetraspora malaysiensis TaxID=161358 RepID=UPI003D8E4B2B
MNSGSRVPYIAILVFKTQVGGGYAPPRFSEDIVLLHALSLDEARAAADSRGREDETSYANEYGETVTWTFVGVADVREALYDSLDEDVSLYSRSFDELTRYKQVFSIESLRRESDS